MDLELRGRQGVTIRLVLLPPHLETLKYSVFMPIPLRIEGVHSITLDYIGNLHSVQCHLRNKAAPNKAPGNAKTTGMTRAERRDPTISSLLSLPCLPHLHALSEQVAKDQECLAKAFPFGARGN